MPSARGPLVRERSVPKWTRGERERRRCDAAALAGSVLVLGEVSEFAELARAGAHIAGDRRVSRRADQVTGRR